MAKLLQSFLILSCFYQFIGADDAVVRQQKFTNRCNTLCTSKIENGTTGVQAECIRGCQYFNLEFLLRSGKSDKTIDLNELVERCGSTCREAYTNDKSKKELCFHGCNEMMLLQSKAPYVNGLLVYMGATDRNMALMASDFDKPTKHDWVLLNSILSANYDYDEDVDEKYTADVRHVEQNQEYLPDTYCIPAWMWMLPVSLILLFIWLNYSNYIYSAFIHESLRQEFGLVGDNKKFVGVQQPPDAYGVGNEYYFYPMPAIPPPKYDESILMTDCNEDNTQRQQQPC